MWKYLLLFFVYSISEPLPLDCLKSHSNQSFYDPKDTYDLHTNEGQSIRIAHLIEKQGRRICCVVLCLITPLCPTLCDPMDCSLPGSSVRGDSLGKNTGVGCHAQVSCIAGRFFTSWAIREAQEYQSGQPIPSSGAFLTPKLNQGLLHSRRILHQLSYQGSPNQAIIQYKIVKKIKRMSESQISTVFAMVHNSTSDEVKRWKEIINSIG